MYKRQPLNKVDWIKSSESWQNDKRNPNPKQYSYQYTSIIPKEYRANIKTNDQIKTAHPTEKNHDLIRRLIEVHSNPNDIVLDCFCGVGSLRFFHR